MGRASRVKWCLLGCLVSVVVLLGIAVFIPGKLASAVKWVANNDFAYTVRAFMGPEKVKEGALIEMVVDTVGVSGIDYKPVVILKEKVGERYLPIWIGPAEATAISVVLEGVSVERPLTSDLLCSVISRMGASVDYIVINDLKNNTFYANIILNVDWMQVRVDSRPSDAIAVAVRVRAPIYAERAVLEKAGIKLDHKTGKYIIMHVGKGQPDTGVRLLGVPGWLV